MRPKDYGAIHTWLFHNHRQSKVICECKEEKCFCNGVCSKKNKLSFALMRGKKYEKNRLNYIILCMSCHKFYDSKKCTKCDSLIIGKEKALCRSCSEKENYRKGLVSVSCRREKCTNKFKKHKNNKKQLYCSNNCRIKSFLLKGDNMKKHQVLTTKYTKKRYKTDNEFRERMNSYQRKRYKENMKNPEFREKIREKGKRLYWAKKCIKTKSSSLS